MQKLDGIRSDWGQPQLPSFSETLFRAPLKMAEEILRHKMKQRSRWGMFNATRVRGWLVMFDTGRVVMEESRFVHPGSRRVLWGAQVEMHFDSTFENSCCPYETDYLGKNCFFFSWRLSDFCDQGGDGKGSNKVKTSQAGPEASWVAGAPARWASCCSASRECQALPGLPRF